MKMYIAMCSLLTEIEHISITAKDADIIVVDDVSSLEPEPVIFEYHNTKFIPDDIDFIYLVDRDHPKNGVYTNRFNKQNKSIKRHQSVARSNC